MSFDTLAPHYRWMEWLFARGKMQRCRTAFLQSIPAPGHALLCGEGNGRFLESFCRQFPASHVTVLDSSEAMLHQARENLSRAGLDKARVSFVLEDVLSWEPPEATFDLIVTCFFLDCFREEDLRRIMPRIARAAKPQAQWLYADFQVSGSVLSRLRSHLTVQFLYAFFTRVTQIKAHALVSPEPFLLQAGFTRRQRRESDWGRLYSEWWNRLPAANGDAPL